MTNQTNLNNTEGIDYTKKSLFLTLSEKVDIGSSLQVAFAENITVDLAGKALSSRAKTAVAATTEQLTQ